MAKDKKVDKRAQREAARKAREQQKVLKRERAQKSAEEKKLQKEEAKKLKEQQLLLKKEEDEKKEQLKICQNALRSVTQANFFWFVCLLPFVAAGYFAYEYGLIPFKTVDFEHIATIIFASILVILIITRLVSNWGVAKRFTFARKEHLKQMPEDATTDIRELYVSYNCRKCMHYWLTLGFACLSVIAILYTLFWIGIEWATKDSVRSKLFNFSSYSISTLDDYQTWIQDWTQQLTFGSLIFLVLILIQYVWFNSNNKKVIAALENTYGKEKLVNECMVGARVLRINNRYKTTVFIIVCLFGCLFYLFFKRLITAVFDRSFSF